MIRVVIVEDEKWACKEIEKNLNFLRPDTISVVAKLESVEQSVEWFLNNKADLVFMDIHLGDGNSFSILEQVDLQCPIIFTTAFNQYALQAFKHFSIDYLLKPIDIDDLENAIYKYEKRFANKLGVFNYQDLSNFMNANNSTKFKERFVVSSGELIHSIEIDNVAYFMAEGKALYLVSTAAKRYLIDGNLSLLEKRLEPSKFFRVNRQFYISFKAIGSMVQYSKYRIKINLTPKVLDLDNTIVSQDRTSDFKQWLDQ